MPDYHPTKVQDTETRIIDQFPGLLARSLKAGIEGCTKILQAPFSTDDHRKTASLTRIKYKKQLKELEEE